MVHFSLPESSFCSCCYLLVSGIQFKPTEKELLQNFLSRKIHGLQLPCNPIVEKDVYACEPWLFQDPNLGEEKYYFVRRERKSESINGKNPKRCLKAAENAKGGWWKATNGDQIISNKKSGVIGYKKTLKFCMYKSDKRNRNECIKTDWIMHEFRLPSTTFQEWVICGIKNNDLGKVEDIQNLSQESIVTQPMAQHGQYNILEKFVVSHQQISQLDQHHLDKELIGSQPISQFDPNDDLEDFASYLENELQSQEEYNEKSNNALTSSNFQDQAHYNDSAKSMNMMWNNQDYQVQELIAMQPTSQHDQCNIPREPMALQQISQLDQHNLDKDLIRSQPISQFDPNDNFEDFAGSLENELRYQKEYGEENNNALTMSSFQTSNFQDQMLYNDGAESMNMMWDNQYCQVQELIAMQPISQHGQYNIPREPAALQQISQLDQHILNKELIGSLPISQLAPNDDFKDVVGSLKNKSQYHEEYDGKNNNAFTTSASQH